MREKVRGKNIAELLVDYLVEKLREKERLLTTRSYPRS